jgi:integral membrane protein
MFNTVLGRLRIVGLLEGLSFIILLGIAMPLKYLYNSPEAVRIIGMAHGILFMLYIALTIQSKLVYRWSFMKMYILWIASVVPLGTFIADYKMLRKDPVKLS